jgi:ketosteroid isomerase-like protein
MQMTQTNEQYGPSEIVIHYLKAIEARDLSVARGFLAEDVEMIFPGGRCLSSPEQIFVNSGRRYQRVAKRIKDIDVIEADSQTVVYCFGTLYGEWINGQSFEGIRFIDRFVLVDGKIVSQEVWNDTGEWRLTATESLTPKS